MGGCPWKTNRNSRCHILEKYPWVLIGSPDRIPANRQVTGAGKIKQQRGLAIAGLAGQADQPLLADCSKQIIETLTGDQMLRALWHRDLMREVDHSFCGASTIHTAVPPRTTVDEREITAHH